jgi:hypothetical protein
MTRTAGPQCQQSPSSVVSRDQFGRDGRKVSHFAAVTMAQFPTVTDTVSLLQAVEPCIVFFDPFQKHPAVDFSSVGQGQLTE